MPIGSPPKGLGQVIGGLGQIAYKLWQHRTDPKKDEREKLLEFLQVNPQVAQQYRDNPAMLQSVTERFGDRGSQITDFIGQMQMSPLQVEQNRISNLQTREAFNQPGVLNSIANAGDLTAGRQVPNFQNVRTVDDARRLTAGLNPQESEKLQEFREVNNIEKSEKTRRRETALTTSAENQATASTEAMARAKDAQRIAMELAAKYGKTGLYQARKSGQISDDQFAAVMEYEPVRLMYNDAQDEYWRQLNFNEQKRQFNQQRTDVAKNRLDLLAREMVERSNFELTYPEAEQLVHNPRVLQQYYGAKAPPTDPNELRLYNAAQTLKRIRERTSRQELARVNSEFGKDARQIRESLNRGQIDVARAISQLNEASRFWYGPMGYAGPSFGKGVEKRRLGFDRDQVVLVDSDVSIPGLDFPVANADQSKGKIKPTQNTSQQTTDPNLESEVNRVQAVIDYDAPIESKVAAINASDLTPEAKAEAIRRARAKTKK